MIKVVGSLIPKVILKNVGSSTSHKKTLKLWYYGILAFFFLARSFMNRFWCKFQFYHYHDNDKFFLKVIKGHKRSSKKFIYLFLMPDFLKPFQECQHYENINFLSNEVWTQRSYKATFMPKSF